MTWVILGSSALTFFLTFIGAGSLPGGLAFQSLTFFARPWTAFTYPLLATGQVLWLLLAGYMYWLFGGSLERAWGHRDYTLFQLLVTGASAVGLWLGAVLLGRDAFLTGLGMPLAATVLAWTVINPRERLLVYFAIPMEARWLGVVVLVLVVVSFAFPLGFFALAGCGVAWWYVRSGRYLLSGGPAGRWADRTRSREIRRSLNPVELLRRWRRKRRFIRLIKGSGLH